MKKRYHAIALMLTAVLAAAMLLVSCGQEADEGGDSTEALTIIYEGYSNETNNYVTLHGEGPVIESRTYGVLIENTSDKDIQKASFAIIGLDENGEALKNEDGQDPRSSMIMMAALKPGERVWVESMDGEWETVPASFTVETANIVWGSGTKDALSIAGVETLEKNDNVSIYELTIRNDGDNEYEWINDWSEVNAKPGRQFIIIGADRDGEGNIIHAERPSMISDISTFSPLEKNMTIVPGGEIKVIVADNNNLEDPEFMLCWY